MGRLALVNQELNYRGGTERQFIDTIHGFAAVSKELTVVAARVDRSLPLPEGIRLVTIDVSRVPKPLRPWFFDRRVRAFLERERFDGVYSLSRLRAAVTLYCAGTRRGSIACQPWRINDPLDRLFSRFEQRAYHCARHVIACSEMIRDELLEHYALPKEQIRIVPPPIDTRRFRLDLRRDRESFRRRFALPPGRKAFAFVSTGHGRKGLDLLRRAFAELPDDFELLVAGTPTPASRNVRSLGFVKDVECLYAAADFTVLPAWYEPFGLVVAESLACGTPVLVSDRVGSKGIVGAEEGLVVAGLEPTAWLEALREAPTRSYRVDPDIVARAGLSLEGHVQRLLPLCLTARSHAERRAG